MHVTNRPAPGARRQLPPSRTGVIGDAVGAGAATTGEAVGAATTGEAVGATANTATAPDTVGVTKSVTPCSAAAVVSAVAKEPSVTASFTTVVIESAVAVAACAPETVTVKSSAAEPDWSRLRRRERLVQSSSEASTIAPLIVASIAAANTAASSAPSANVRGARARHKMSTPRRASSTHNPSRSPVAGRRRRGARLSSDRPPSARARTTRQPTHNRRSPSRP